MPSGAHLGGPRPPKWAPEGREVSHSVVVIDRFHCISVRYILFSVLNSRHTISVSSKYRWNTFLHILEIMQVYATINWHVGFNKNCYVNFYDT